MIYPDILTVFKYNCKCHFLTAQILYPQYLSIAFLTVPNRYILHFIMNILRFPITKSANQQLREQIHLYIA
jgi:hypothetical protein